MISLGAEYSLRAAVCLARRPGVAMTVHEIAQSAAVPAGYLAKVLHALARAGIIGSQRGANGGFCLRVSPDRVTLMEIVRVVDRSRRVPLAIDRPANAGGELRELYKRLDAAAIAAEEPLRDTTLADVLGPPVPTAAAAT